MYACIDEKAFDEYHRMLYVFACLSEKCIGTQDAIRVFKAIVPDTNSLGIKFQSDEQINTIYDKSNNQLTAMGILDAKQEELKVD